MKQNLLLLGVAATLFIFSGCNANKQQPTNEQKVQEEKQIDNTTKEVENTTPQQSESAEKQAEQSKKAEMNDASANIPFTYYSVIPSQIEVFSYRGLNNSTIIDDGKLNDSFYLKGNYIRIEKILTSKLGDKYGKIVGKGLLVSMDDLEIKQ